VRYDDLIANPGQTVMQIYERFGFSLSSLYRMVLEEEEKADRYASSHFYSLEQTGLTRDEIVSTFREIFDRFKFDTMER
jgi:hypothetical protein